MGQALAVRGDLGRSQARVSPLPETCPGACPRDMSHPYGVLALGFRGHVRSVGGSRTIVGCAEVAEEPVDGEQGRRSDEAGDRAVAAPAPMLGSIAKAGAHRVQHHVPSKRKHVPVTLDENGVEPVLEQVPIELVPTVEPLGVHTVQPMHAGRQIRLGGLDDRVVVIVHQTVGVTAPFTPLHYLSEHAEKLLAISAVDEDLLSPVAPRGDMEDTSGSAEAGASCHSTTVRIDVAGDGWRAALATVLTTSFDMSRGQARGHGSQ